MPSVADANHFRCLCCGRDANTNPAYVADGRYIIEGKRYVGICAYCRGLSERHRARTPRRSGMAEELHELAYLISQWEKRGELPDAARQRAVLQQVRAEDIAHPEFMGWLRQHKRL